MQDINELDLNAVSDRLKSAAQHYDTCKTTAVLLLKRAEILARENPSAVEKLVDLAYFADRISKDTEAAGKEARKVLELLGQLACANYIAQSMGDPTATEQLTGWVATGTVKMSAQATIPAKDTEEYRILMRHLGLSESTIDADIVRPHWPHVQELVTIATEKGLQPPPGIDPKSVRIKYSLSNLRLKKGATNNSRKR